jgi:carboxyl-terminal processing protease
MNRMTKWLRKLAIGSALVAAGALVVAATILQTDDDVYFSIKKNLSIFGALYEELAVGYVDPVDPGRLMQTGLRSMLRTLDPYTVFIDEASNEEIDIVMRGRYAGVGLTVTMNNGEITVVNPVEGYSGFRQGVRAGDVIVEVDSQAVGDLIVSDISGLLRGDPGSSVRLVVEREGEAQPIEFLLTREQVRLKNVTYADFIDGTSIAYVRLERFAREAYSEVHRAVKSLAEQRELEGIILDLRDNPGGLLEAAVDISGIFVEQGTEIVSTRGRLPQTQRSYRSRKAPVETEVPFAVLVNGNSASASEIVAGAIQDLDRGVVIGERTFGKGLVQIIRPLPYNTSLKMTTSKYYTPSGRSIQAITYTHRAEDGYAVAVADSLQKLYRTSAGREVKGGGGIAPDVEVMLAPVSEFEEALIRKSAFFRFANQFAAENPTVPEDFVPSDETLKLFQAWLSDDGFDFRGRSEWLVDQLEEESGVAEYDLADQIEELRTSIKGEKAGDFKRYETELRENLRQEILARYYGETAQIRASLVHDDQIRASVDLLSNPGKVENILKGER